MLLRGAPGKPLHRIWDPSLWIQAVRSYAIIQTRSAAAIDLLLSHGCADVRIGALQTNAPNYADRVIAGLRLFGDSLGSSGSWSEAISFQPQSLTVSVCEHPCTGTDTIRLHFPAKLLQSRKSGNRVLFTASFPAKTS
jgi:hypothetical protein